MATGIAIPFRTVLVGEEFANEDGDVFEKRNSTMGEVVRSHGMRDEGDEVNFGPDEEVTLLT
jgi:hypothetical protein